MRLSYNTSPPLANVTTLNVCEEGYCAVNKLYTQLQAGTTKCVVSAFSLANHYCLTK